MQQLDLDDRRMFNTLTIFALLIRCPAGGGECADKCPFTQFRKGRGLEEKFMIAESLPDEKCRELLAHHERCLASASRSRLNTLAWGQA